ncbi:MAG: hypothetical protein OEV31_09460, partial [Gammaproteobacteria bacterium]|nr:hypothetical protein [Gammaproteobacteria bacterium]
MLAPKRFAALAVMACLMLFQAGTVIAAKQPDDCPKSLTLEAEQRLAQLQSTRQHLKDFMSGETIVDTPLSALFVVDLKNETAVQSRVKELQAFKNKGQTSTDPSAPFLDCAKPRSALLGVVEKLKEEQLLLDQQRLDFLFLPPDWRNGLINTHADRKKQATAVVRLAEERTAADKLQSEAALSVATAEEKAKTAASIDLREIAAQRALLEKTRETLGRLQAEMVTELQERAKFYQLTSEKLSALTALTVNGDSSKSLPDAYKEAVAIWRELV